MPYNKKTWQGGEILASSDMNKFEDAMELSVETSELSIVRVTDAEAELADFGDRLTNQANRITALRNDFRAYLQSNGEDIYDIEKRLADHDILLKTLTDGWHRGIYLEVNNFVFQGCGGIDAIKTPIQVTQGDVLTITDPLYVMHVFEVNGISMCEKEHADYVTSCTITGANTVCVMINVRKADQTIMTDQDLFQIPLDVIKVN